MRLKISCKNLIRNLLLINLTIVALTPYSSAADHWPGIPCATTTECGSETRMVCNLDSKKCTCLTYDGFDYNEKACFLTVGNTCTGLEPSTELTPHSSCNTTSGKIECHPDYPRTGNNKCARLIDSDCAESKDCDRDLFLECSSANSKCACPEKSSFKDGTCKWNSKEVCEIEENPGPPKIRCPSHLLCDEDPEDSKRNICKCLEFLKENSKGVCVGTYDDRCIPGDKSEYPCDDTAFLWCDEGLINKRCKCLNPDDTFFDWDGLEICRIRLNRKCVKGQQPCRESAECKDYDDGDGNTGTRCECEEGLIAFNGQCFLPFGADCDEENGPRCNFEGHMSCNGGKCGCSFEDEAQYNDSKGICEGLPGTQCSHSSDSMPCAELTECDYLGTRTCKCIEGYVQGNKKCFVAHGGNCDENDPSRPSCYEDAFVTCQDGKCACAENPDVGYENLTNSCVLLEGATCTKEPGKQSCVAFSECIEEEGSFSCHCIENHGATKERACSALYNQDCDIPGAASCNKDDFLVCDLSRKCTCGSYYTEKWYNPITRKCDIGAEFACKNGTDEQKCVPFSFCNGDGKCACADNLIVSKGYECVVPYNGKCGTPEGPRCYDETFQTCDEIKGRCACAGNPDDVWYDPRSGVCVLNLRMPCVPNDGSVQQCGHYTECERDEESNEGHCQCLEGLTEYENQCYTEYNHYCYDEFAPCRPDKFLTCQTKCGCASNATYNPTNGFCDLRAGELCLNAKDAQPCADHSSCESVNGTYTCVCDEGLTISADGKCVIPFGSVCQQGTGAPCDTNAFEYCTSSGVCKCAENGDVWYDPRAKSCVLLEGADCDPYKQPCVEYSECAQITAGSNFYQCACAEGLVSSKNRRCIAHYEEECGRDGDALCNLKEFLSCEENKCACAGSKEYTRFDEFSKECRILPGAQCEDNWEKQKCATFSECGYPSKSCECKSNLIESSNKECVLPYGEPCSLDQDKAPCNKEGNQYCDIKSGSCACVSPELVLSNGTACVRPYNASCGEEGMIGDCDLYGNQACIKNKCTCLDTFTMVYNTEKKECFLKMNSSCLDGENVIQCDVGLTCSALGKCECDGKLGLVNDGSGACVKTLNTPCNEDEGPLGGCDGREYLICYEGLCTCNPKYYDVKVEATEEEQNWHCVGNRKAPCKSNNNCKRVLKCDVDQGFCECDSGHNETYNEDTHQCYSNLGGRCQLTFNDNEVALSCNPKQNLECFQFEGNDDKNFGRCGCGKPYYKEKNGVCMDGDGASVLNITYEILNLGLIITITYNYLIN